MKINVKNLIRPALILFITGILLLDTSWINAQIQRPVGTNLSGIQDWSTEFVFVDAFKQSRAWISHNADGSGPWSSGIEIPLDQNGYPLEIPYDNGIDPPQSIRTLMFFGDLDGHYPAGQYSLKSSGEGQIRLWGAAQGTFKSPVDTTVLVDPSIGGIGLEIDTSISANPVRDIRFIMPGYEDTYDTQIFNPDFLDFLNDFQLIRFMDWMETNNSPVQNWSDRNFPEYFTQTLENGVAYEYILELCNELKKDAWICIPHRAGDEYIRQLARFFRDGMDTDLQLYIEYSNEVWNSIFDQYHYSVEQGDVLEYAGNPWEQAWQYYAKRTADVFSIFEEEFQDDDRIVNVISSQAANSWVSNYILEKFNDSQYNPAQTKAEALAIAPYFGGAVANLIGDEGNTDLVTVDDIMDSLELSLDKSFAWITDLQSLAENYDLKLICYEGGQHLVAGYPYNEDESFVEKLTAANHHPSMEDLYCTYLDYWYVNSGGGLFCNFSSHGLYSKYGSWGIKEFMDDYDNPKYQAFQNCVFPYNSDTTTTSIDPVQNPVFGAYVYPNPSRDRMVCIRNAFENACISIYALDGKQVGFEILEKNKERTTLRVNADAGLYWVQLTNNRKFTCMKLLLY